mmetsp:Transcript_50503/g.86874  ORF Transcript_50503/g.86874 Transcript_50503/m.86874 type:complete len:343 (+) Transcript_50503:2129-3157(+)
MLHLLPGLAGDGRVALGQRLLALALQLVLERVPRGRVPYGERGRLAADPGRAELERVGPGLPRGHRQAGRPREALAARQRAGQAPVRVARVDQRDLLHRALPGGQLELQPRGGGRHAHRGLQRVNAQVRHQPQRAKEHLGRVGARGLGGERHQEAVGVGVRGLGRAHRRLLQVEQRVLALALGQVPVRHQVDAVRSSEERRVKHDGHGLALLHRLLVQHGLQRLLDLGLGRGAREAVREQLQGAVQPRGARGHLQLPRHGHRPAAAILFIVQHGKAQRLHGLGQPDCHLHPIRKLPAHLFQEHQVAGVRAWSDWAAHQPHFTHASSIKLKSGGPTDIKWSSH